MTTTKTPLRTPAQQYDDLVAEHDRVLREFDKLVTDTELLRADRDQATRLVDAVADLLDRAEDGFATVVRIKAVRAAVGRAYLPRTKKTR